MKEKILLVVLSLLMLNEIMLSQTCPVEPGHISGSQSGLTQCTDITVESEEPATPAFGYVWKYTNSLSPAPPLDQWTIIPDEDHQELTDYEVCESTLFVRGALPHRKSSCDTVWCQDVVVISFSPLPAEIVQFNAIPEIDHVLIEFRTASESNVDKFIIQRSLTGRVGDYEDLVNIMAVNEATGSYYGFKDYSPSLSNYYRIKTIDFTGDVNYTHIVHADFFDASLAQALTINGSNIIPAGNTASLRYETTNGETATAQLMQVSAQSSGTQQIDGDFQFYIPHPGTWYVIIKSNYREPSFLKIVAH